MKSKVLIFSLLLAIITNMNAEIINRVIAMVNDEPITAYDFRKRKELLEKQLRSMGKSVKDEDVLDRMIEEKVLKQEARKLGVSVTRNEIEAQKRETMEQYGITSEDVLKVELKKQGMTLKQFEDQIEMTLLMQYMLGQVVQASEVTDEEAKTFYEENKDKDIFKGGVSILSISWIYVDLPEDGGFMQQYEKSEKIQEAHKKVKSGVDFSTVAKKYSEDEKTKSEGGKLGRFAPSDDMPLPAQMAFRLHKKGLKEGDVSDIQEFEGGLWFVKIDKVEKKESRGYADYKTQIKNMLYQQKLQDKFKKWLDEQIDSSIVKKML